MNKYDICPVPKEQIPLIEYESLTASWFFNLPTSKDNKLYFILLISWAIMIPIFITISSGSFQLRSNILRLLLVSIVTSLVVPILILLRQWLAWNYILNRLKSGNIEHEKSGWYDGQTWEKPINLRSRDLLIANYEVIPIISFLTKPLILISSIELVGITAFFF